MSVQRTRQTKPRCNVSVSGYRLGESFEQSGTATRRELAEAFVEETRKWAARVEEEHQSGLWDERWRFPEVERRAREYTCRRQAWAEAIDLLWQYSRAGKVDADALREALIRQSVRRYHTAGDARKSGKPYWRNISAEEHEFCRAASLVRDVSDLERMADERDDEIHETYRRNRA